MKRGIKHQLKKKTLFFIAVFTIALFVFPGETFASHLIDESISWMYREGHLYLNFEANVTTDEMEILLYNWYFLQEGNMTGRLTPAGEDFSVVKGGYYSMPIVWINDDGTAIENEDGVTLIQLYEKWGVTLKGDGSHYIDEITYDMLQNMRVYVGEDYAYAEPWVFFTETPLPPIIEATFPPTGETTNVGLGSFTATGYFDLGIMTWSYLRIGFSTATTTYFFNSDFFAEDEWQGDYEIPVNLLYMGTYDVNYTFINMAWEGWLGHPEDVFIHEVPIATTTLIVNIGMKPEWLDFIETDYFIGEEPEEGTIQHFIWSIHKFLINLIIPSKEIRVSLLNLISKVETLFPYNYIKITKDFYSDVEADVEQDPTLEITLFGASAETISMSIFDTEITIKSETKPLFSWIKLIMTYLLWGGFLIFAINFLKRIL